MATITQDMALELNRTIISKLSEIYKIAVKYNEKQIDTDAFNDMIGDVVGHESTYHEVGLCYITKNMGRILAIHNGDEFGVSSIRICTEKLYEFWINSGMVDADSDGISKCFPVPHPNQPAQIGFMDSTWEFFCGEYGKNRILYLATMIQFFTDREHMWCINHVGSYSPFISKEEI